MEQLAQELKELLIKHNASGRLFIVFEDGGAAIIEHFPQKNERIIKSLFLEMMEESAKDYYLELD